VFPVIFVLVVLFLIDTELKERPPSAALVFDTAACVLLLVSAVLYLLWSISKWREVRRKRKGASELISSKSHST